MPVNLIPGEFTSFSVAIAILSGFIIFFGYISMFLKERLFLSEAFVAVIVGIIAGPLVTNGIDPYSWRENDEITKQLARCIIAVQVMAVGIELPKHYMKKDWKTMIVLLLPVMIVMWMVSGLIIWWLVPTLNYVEALVISACICPTDPILANSVVKGRFAEKHVPSHIRNALSAESGANDGMGFPFLFLAIFIIGEDDIGKAVGKWIYETCLFQIALSCVIGVVVGWAARKALQWSERNHLIDKPSFLSFAIALALFLMSMTGFSGSDDVLACFVAGNAFSWDDWFRQETEEAHFQDVIDMMLNLAIFVYIGAIIPWSDFGNAELGLSAWRLIAIAILVLLFRRLPIVVLLKPVMPAINTYQEAVFTGWFGPMGVGAVFLSKIAKEELLKVYAGQEEPVSVRLINPIVLFIVLSSVVVHGTTIPLFKLGKSLQTRTLSIGSVTSNVNGAASKSPLSSYSSFRREEGGGVRARSSRDKGSPMTELQRNTLFNTIQRGSQNKETLTTDIITLADQGPGFLINMQATAIGSSLKSNAIKSHENSCDESENTGLESVTFNAGLYLQQQGSMATIGSQTIRFIEPINPRTAITVMGVENNEASSPQTPSINEKGRSNEYSSVQKTRTFIFPRFLAFFRPNKHSSHHEETPSEQAISSIPHDDSPPIITVHSTALVLEESLHPIEQDMSIPMSIPMERPMEVSTDITDIPLEEKSSRDKDHCAALPSIG